MSSRAWPAPPAGFVLRADGVQAIYVATSDEEAFRARRLQSPETWRQALVGEFAASGRGATAVICGGFAGPWRIKAMRRGGGLARLWSDRYPSARRLVDTLSVSAQAQDRGVPTARPIALVVEAERFGLVRAAMAFEEIEDASDLARLARKAAMTRDGLTAIVGAVRAMHDHGVLHPDLNLGNLLLRQRAGAPIEAFIIDFDRATVAPGPLPFAARQSALRRMERSCAKLTGLPGLFGPSSEDLWYTTYARGDAELSRRLANGRRWGRLWLAFHRLAWRRPTT